LKGTPTITTLLVLSPCRRRYEATVGLEWDMDRIQAPATVYCAYDKYVIFSDDENKV